MKKMLITSAVTILILAFMTQMGWLEIVGIHRISFYTNEENTRRESSDDKYNYVTEGSLSYRVKAEGASFYVYNDGKWDVEFMTGVNIGAGEPGIFPGELTISYETYYSWFELISEMNANCIRVYTTMRPQFYEALRDFNEQAENPLYLYHGVWMDEDDIAALSDVHSENAKILNEFKQDALNAVDVVHGNISLPKRSGFASGTYTADVSKWLAGWIVGIEWEPDFVQTTNSSNPDANTYDGAYLYTQGATPFEAFLCEVGDEVIAHETENYSFQAPLAFTNWITTDPISHPGEPHYDEDSTVVNTENIKSRSSFLPGMFVSYHIYPYYPDCLNYQEDYLNYTDESGKVNTYRAYLADLRLAHTLPMLVAEFGIPTSRGMGHESVMGYNQGYVDEAEQGAMIIDMFESMNAEQYAGGLVFTWQDEWFKRTWNNVNFDIADRRPFWSNIQTTEQCFGLLSFDPGEEECTCYIDGDLADWSGVRPVVEGGDGALYVQSDERYMYFAVSSENYDFDSDRLVIALDTKSGQGNSRAVEYSLSFDRQADFLIVIDGENESRIVCDSYYDCFYYLYGEQYKMIETDPHANTVNSGYFNEMMMCYGYELTVPTTGEYVPFKAFETGKLTYGVSNPDSEEYRSLADFCYNEEENFVEIRIPWQLLNVTDPSEKKIMSDFHAEQVFASESFDSFAMGFAVQNGGESRYFSLGGEYSYDGWTMPTYHERLKPAYYELAGYLAQFRDGGE